MFHEMKSNQGNITITVVGILFLTLIIAALVMSYASNQNLWELVTENRTDALYYANEGYSQALFEMNKNSTFYSDSGSGYTMVADDTSRQVWRKSAAAGDNYSVEIEIPKSGGVLSKDLSIIRVTAWTPEKADVKRTVEAELQKRNILDYATLLRNMSSNAVYGSDEAVFGPAHSNGDFYCQNGARFWGLVTMAGKLYVQNKETAVPIAPGASNTFQEGAKQIGTIEWPRDNSSLKTWAQMPGGAYYSGRTCIYLDDAAYRVRSWDGQNSNWIYNGVPYSVVTVGSQQYYRRLDTLQDYSSWSLFRDSCPAALPLPASGIIYVDGAEPSYYGTSPNYTWHPEDYTSKFNPGLGNVFISGRLRGKLTVAAAGDIFISSCDPTNWENNAWGARTTDGRYDGLSYADSTATVYYGKNEPYKSKILPPAFLDPSEINTNNPLQSVVVPGGDILGLCANYCVKLHQFNWPRQPEWGSGGRDCWGTNGDRRNVVGLGNNDHMQVCSAIFAILGTYGVEDYTDSGSSQRRRNTFGSIAMNVTTATYSGGNGYRESNCYDPRLNNESPPHFLVPECVGWAEISWREVNGEVE